MMFLGFTFINDMRLQQGLIMEILLIAILILVLFSIFGGKSKKTTYSWDKKKGASIFPLTLSLILVVILMVYVFISMFNGSVITF